jgi:hypothetical protein
MTLIEVRNSDGLVGRCDARCYLATHPKCHCICGGKNHGAGSKQALANTKALCLTWLKKCQEEHPDAEITQVTEGIQKMLL